MFGRLSAVAITAVAIINNTRIRLMFTDCRNPFDNTGYKYSDPVAANDYTTIYLEYVTIKLGVPGQYILER